MFQASAGKAPRAQSAVKEVSLPANSSDSWNRPRCGVPDYPAQKEVHYRVRNRQRRFVLYGGRLDRTELTYRYRKRSHDYISTAPIWIHHSCTHYFKVIWGYIVSPSTNLRFLKWKLAPVSSRDHTIFSFKTRILLKAGQRALRIPHCFTERWCLSEHLLSFTASQQLSKNISDVSASTADRLSQACKHDPG